MAKPVNIYGGHPFFALTPAIVADIKGSGFTTVTAWSLHVHPNGDLFLNDNPLVQNGKYTNNSSWPGYVAQLKQQPTAVTQLGFSIGTGSSTDFGNIQNLIEQQGTGPGSTLYKNFSALQQTIPSLDFIDMDDEVTYDHTSMVAFSKMLHALGLYITFCPFELPSFWIDCLADLDSAAPGMVQAFNLQCYNPNNKSTDPGDWISAIQAKMGAGFDAAALVRPGMEPQHVVGPNTDGTAPSLMQVQFATWTKKDNIGGGFVYLYDFIEANQASTTYSSSDYAQALIKGLS